MESTLTCAEHEGVPSLAPCSRCGRACCDECLTFMVEGLASCGACAHIASAQAGRPWGFAVAVLLTGGAASLALARAESRDGGEPSYYLYGTAAVVMLAISGFIVARKRRAIPTEPRVVGDEIEIEVPAAGPYRAMVQRRFVPRTLPLSGRLTALALLLCFAFTGLAAPFALHLPKWLEAEVVLFSWWITWSVALGVVLYRGSNVSDDHRFAPSLWLPDNLKPKKKSPAEKKKSGGGWFDSLPDFDGISGADGEGCFFVLGAIVLAGAAVIAAWLLVELIVPAVFTLAYLLLIRALKVVTSDRRDCKGNVLRAAGYGVLWGTVYIVPLALVVLAVHAVARRHGL